MTLLYKVFRTAFPGDTPEQCAFSGIEKVVLRRNEVLDIPAGGLAVVLAGQVVEELVVQSGRKATVGVYGVREVIYGPVGVLRAQQETHVITLSSGWKAAMPEAHRFVLSARESLFRERTGRLASAMTETITERVHAFAKENPEVRSPTVVARLIGASREMCSRALKELDKEKA